MVKSYDYGLASLKFLLAFCIVWLHFGNADSGFHPSWAVPAFMSASFYLMGSLWEDPRWPALLKRLVRLSIPFFSWGVLYWLLHGIFMRHLSMRALFWQLAVGHTVCQPLYFLFLLGLLTVLVFALTLLFGNRLLVPAAVLVLVCLLSQYSGINYRTIGILCNRAPEAVYPLGRIAELLPAALAGLLLSSESRRGAITRHACATAAIGAMLFALGLSLDRIFPAPSGFDYQGFPILLSATSLMALFLAANRILSRYPEVCKMLRNLSSLTLGVYCLHWMIGSALINVCHLNRSMTTTISTFALSVLGSLILSRSSLTRRLVC